MRFMSLQSRISNNESQFHIIETKGRLIGNCKSVNFDISHHSPADSSLAMSLRSSTRTLSTCSTDTMASVASQQSQHPYLDPGRASTITLWTSSIERSHQPQGASKNDDKSREAAIEAYRQLKAALFSKAGVTTSSRTE
jgi:hypothetical protein